MYFEGDWKSRSVTLLGFGMGVGAVEAKLCG